MVGIVDYGMGNLLSVFNALDWIGAEVEIITSPPDLESAERIILPGVGAFRDCIATLNETGFAAALQREVIEKKKPIFGICLGMQVMAKRGLEGGKWEGLGWFDADIVRIQPDDPQLKVPQVGWNQIQYDQQHPIFQELPQNPEFYFVHSYHMAFRQPQDIVATTDYGMAVTAAVCRENIFATQFHPEKSQDYGLKILENFLNWGRDQ
ncbi:MAG: imidazole glycerol phosphate synthase subunit HisH [Bacteroidia bacterium]|nr:imidazole glycerol phosphate synthase subunit HisH [Bacteroidia bacterium]